MKTIQTTVLITSLTTSIAFGEMINFDNLKPGAPPPGWTATKTGTGQAKWEVVADDSAPSKPNVLKQSGEATYPVCIKDDTSVKDGFVQVKFKPISGKEDQAGGVVWRCRDANHYYIARANALEDNVTICHTIRRRQSRRLDQSRQRHIIRRLFLWNQVTLSPPRSPSTISTASALPRPIFGSSSTATIPPAATPPCRTTIIPTPATITAPPAKTW